MHPDQIADLLNDLFRGLRGKLPLGIPELLDAHRAVAAGFGGDDAALERLLGLLWCSSPAHKAELARQLDQLLVQARHAEPEDAPSAASPKTGQRPDASPPPPQREPPRPVARPSAKPGSATLMPLPVRAPRHADIPVDDGLLIAANPISRRAMAYSWHRLRRPLADGPRVLLNLPATVERAARQGFFDRPVLERRRRDHAHLILLIDQGGSMVPFHALTREIQETVAGAGLGRVALGWFQNVPMDQVYLNPHRTRPIALEQLLAGCDQDSCLLIVSDAGAARGRREQERFRATTRRLVQLRQRTALLAWLNPVPAARWPGTTAALIAAVVRMFPMDEDGFSNAIDCLRGQALGEPT